MKIESLNLRSFQPGFEAEKKVVTSGNKDFSKVISSREGYSPGIDVSKSTSKEIIENFAEWYFKQGQIYERIKSYKQAISAYEKANSVAPDMSKAVSIENAREKAYKIEK